MASICDDGNGKFRVLFDTPNGKRPCIRVRGPRKLADDTAEHVGYLVACHDHPDSIPAATLTWALALKPKTYNKLADAGLLPRREPVNAKAATLGVLVADVTKGMAHLKANTRRNYGQYTTWLTTYFTDAKPVNDIDAKQADAFVAHLRTEKELGKATVGRAVKAFRMIFKMAMRWKLTDANPFEGIKAGSSSNPSRRVFVPAADVEKIMAATSDMEFRAILALCRYGAVRCPSEVLTLKWGDVRHDEGKLIVRSPKTEAYAGRDQRIVPLFPELDAVLTAWQAEAPEGEYVVTVNRSPEVNWRTRLIRLCEKAGVPTWPKLFHAMRASRESELYARFPLTTVCQWLGHSPKVAAEHYLIDPDKDASFAAARGVIQANPNAARTKVAQKAAQTCRESGVNGGMQKSENPQNTLENAVLCGSSETEGIPPTGFEPVSPP